MQTITLYTITLTEHTIAALALAGVTLILGGYAVYSILRTAYYPQYQNTYPQHAYGTMPPLRNTGGGGGVFVILLITVAALAILHLLGYSASVDQGTTDPTDVPALTEVVGAEVRINAPTIQMGATTTDGRVNDLATIGVVDDASPKKEVELAPAPQLVKRAVSRKKEWAESKAKKLRAQGYKRVTVQAYDHPQYPFAIYSE